MRAWNYQSSYSGVPQGAIDELVALYRQSQDRLKRFVLHPPKGSERAVEFRKARAADLSRQVDRLLESLGKETSNWIGKKLSSAYANGIALADQQAVQAGVRPPQQVNAGSFAAVDRGTVEVFAHDIWRDLNMARKSMGERTKSLLQETASVKINIGTGEVIERSSEQALSESDINRILAGGSVEGAPRETMSRLRESLRQVYGDQIGIPTKSGKIINYKVESYAEMVARTKTRQAAEVSRHERLGRLGIDLVMVIGSRSKNFCTEFLGQIFSLSGKSDKYPPLDSLPQGGPPFHPNCSKSTRPFVEELADPQQADRGLPTPDSSALMDRTPSQAQRVYRQIRSLPKDSGRDIYIDRQGFAPDQPALKFADNQHEEARAWGEANYRQWAESLTTSQKDAVASYQAGKAREINKALWNDPDLANTSEELRKVVSELDSAMANSTLPQDVVVYRGMPMRKDYHQLGNALTGTKLPQPGFLCTSLRRQGAERHMRGGDHPVLIELKIPAGTRAAYLPALTKRQPLDDELLIDRKQPLRVISVASRPGEPLFIKAEVIRE